MEESWKAPRLTGWEAPAPVQEVMLSGEIPAKLTDLKQTGCGSPQSPAVERVVIGALPENAASPLMAPDVSIVGNTQDQGRIAGRRPEQQTASPGAEGETVGVAPESRWITGQ